MSNTISQMPVSFMETMRRTIEENHPSPTVVAPSAIPESYRKNMASFIDKLDKRKGLKVSYQKIEDRYVFTKQT